MSLIKPPMSSGSVPEPNRAPVTLTSPSLAPGATWTTPVALGAVAHLATLTVSSAARARLYTNNTALAADAARPFTNPDLAADVVPYFWHDTLLPHLGLLSYPLGLTVSGSEGGGYALSLTNTDNVARVIAVTYEALTLEPGEVA